MCVRERAHDQAPSNPELLYNTDNNIYEFQLNRTDLCHKNVHRSVCYATDLNQYIMHEC